MIEEATECVERPLSPYRILGVDDSATQRKMMELAFAPPLYEVTLAESGDEAIEILSRDGGRFDVVLLDISMDRMDGFAVCRQIRDRLGLLHLPILIVSGTITSDSIKKAVLAGADEFIIKPFDRQEMRARVNDAAEQKRMMDGLEEPELVLFALARMVEAKDKYCGDHCDRLVHTLRVFARELKLGEADTRMLMHAAIVHDIGKLAVPDEILMKPGRLTDPERAIMQRHATIGEILLSNHPGTAKVAGIVRHHHERLNGSGYPDALSGERVPFLVRVFQIADIYDALGNNRVYNSGFSRDKVIRLMFSEAQKGLWDMELMKVFLSIAAQRPEELERNTSAKVPMSMDKLNMLIDSKMDRKRARTGIGADERR